MAFPQIDPVAFSIGPVDVRWYGLAYMCGLLLGWLYVRRLLASGHLFAGEKSPLQPDQADSLLLWTTLGVVLGGRLGFVLFYQPSFYFENPQDILALWKGGMAFHGGVVGTGVVMFIFARANGAPFLSVADLVSAAVPIGLFFGRIANFINAEVYGRPTDVPWAIIFPKEVLLPIHEAVPRHPSQLYEAATEGLILFAVIAYFIYARGALRWPGYVTGLFLAGYGIARIFCEFFRDFDPDRYFTLGPYLTTGMVYSLPMVLLGIYLLSTSRYRAEVAALDSAR
ncbi:MAG: prolipoprotein diacylglyceryl transferase [Pseudomonadota bacterium]